MAIREHTFENYLRAYVGFLFLYGVLYGITLFLGRFIDAGWDIRLLLWMNPDRYIPLLDELVILQTDFGTYFWMIVLLSWQAGHALSANRPTWKPFMRKLFHVVAVVFGLWHAAGIVVHDKGPFWWGAYELPIVFLPLGLAFFVAFWLAGDLFTRLDDRDQRKLAHAFWLTLLAVFFTNVIGEDIIKATLQRHRPLHAFYEAWNHQARMLSDEVVRGGYSYISGHASSFFALIGVYFWLIKSNKIRGFFLLWAGFHAYTRIYTAAHFPLCAIMGSVFGFGVASLLYFFLWNHRNLSLISPLVLSCSLFFLVRSPVIPSILVTVIVSWQIVYWMLYRRDAFSPPPILRDTINCQEQAPAV